MPVRKKNARPKKGPSFPNLLQIPFRKRCSVCQLCSATEDTLDRLKSREGSIINAIAVCMDQTVTYCSIFHFSSVSESVLDKFVPKIVFVTEKEEEAMLTVNAIAV